MCKKAEALSGMVFVLARELSGKHSALNLSLSHLVRYIVGIPFVYFDDMLESCWLKTPNFVRSLNVCSFVFFCGCAMKRAENFVLWLTIFIPHWNRLPCICGLRRHSKWNSWRPYNWESCSYNAHFLLAMSASTATSEIWVVYQLQKVSGNYHVGK